MFDLGEVANRVSSTFQALPSFKGPGMGQFNIGPTPPTLPGPALGGAGIPGNAAIGGGFGLGPINFGGFGLGPLNFSGGGLGPINFGGLFGGGQGPQLNTDGTNFVPPTPTAATQNTSTGPSGPYSPADAEAYIRHKAASLKIDPDIAAKVADSEGLHTYVGDSNSSFGPFQLHYGNVAAGGNAVGGLGDSFTAQTGLDARDQSTWKDQVDWVLNGLASGKFDWGNGASGWHGAAKQGIFGKTGIGTYSGPVPDYVSYAQPKTDWEQLAESQLSNITGKPYHWGGSDPVTGFDCSGFTSWVFQKAFGITLLHGTTYQYRASQAVDAPQKGDLLFFNMNINDPHMQHVGIYLGDGTFIHDTDFGGKNGVQISNVSAWSNQHPEFRRVVAQ